MQTKQWVGAAALGLIFGSAGSAQAGGMTDLQSGAVGGARESVHKKADSLMDSVGLKQEQKAAEGSAAGANDAAKTSAEGAAAENPAATETAKGAAAETPAATDAAEGAPAKTPAATDAAESAPAKAETATDAAKDAAPKPSVEDAAKGAVKGMLE